jgi:hypothetical protein
MKRIETAVRKCRLLPADGRHSFPYFPHDLVDLKRVQRSWSFFQLTTPGDQHVVLAAILNGLSRNLIDRRIPAFKFHRHSFGYSRQSDLFSYLIGLWLVYVHDSQTDAVLHQSVWLGCSDSENLHGQSARTYVANHPPTCLPQRRIDPDRRRRTAGFFFQTLDLVVQHVDFPLQLGFTPGIH